MTKLEQAQEVARIIKQASDLLATAFMKLEKYDLNLDNYPEYWHDFAEHSLELNNIFVSDFATDSDVQVQIADF